MHMYIRCMPYKTTITMWSQPYVIIVKYLHNKYDRGEDNWEPLSCVNGVLVVLCLPVSPNTVSHHNAQCIKVSKHCSALTLSGSVLTGLPCFLLVGGGELIADGGLGSHHGHLLFSRTQHQSLFSPFRRRWWWAGQPYAAPCLLEATIAFSFSLHQALIRRGGECVRGQSMWSVYRGGPLCL